MDIKLRLIYTRTHYLGLLTTWNVIILCIIALYNITQC